MRKINSSTKNEIQFEIGGKYLRFGLSEFVLIIRLNFSSYPKNKPPYSISLVFTYLNEKIIVKSHELEATFDACTNMEDSWKLRLFILLMVCYIFT